ncbi:MAG: S24 family peptidase [Novosphingobium sp.]
MDKDDPRSLLLDLSRERGASLSQLSRLIGRNGTYLQQFVRKGSPRKLEETDRRTLARFFGIEEAELGAPEDFSSSSAGLGGESEWRDVPRLALGASAGPGALASGEEAIGAFRFATRWLRDQGLDPSALSTIAVAGDSMEPTLRDGDEILVDRTPRKLRDGIHVVRIEDSLLVKRLATTRPGAVTLISDNPAYHALEYPLSELQVVGRVVWKGGRL